MFNLLDSNIVDPKVSTSIQEEPQHESLIVLVSRCLSGYGRQSGASGGKGVFVEQLQPSSIFAWNFGSWCTLKWTNRNKINYVILTSKHAEVKMVVNTGPDHNGDDG